jgi:hypothetical protein
MIFHVQLVGSDKRVLGTLHVTDAMERTRLFHASTLIYKGRHFSYNKLIGQTAIRFIEVSPPLDLSHLEFEG